MKDNLAVLHTALGNIWENAHKKMQAWKNSNDYGAQGSGSSFIELRSGEASEKLRPMDDPAFVKFVKTEKMLDMMHQKTRDLLSSPSFFSRPRAAPSSFAETGSPDSFADLDAKLKQLEEKTKAELAKLQADTAAPSSMLETRGDRGSRINIDEQLRILKQRADEEYEKVSKIKIGKI